MFEQDAKYILQIFKKETPIALLSFKTVISNKRSNNARDFRQLLIKRVLLRVGLQALSA